MMFLTETSLCEVAKRQFIYKLKAYSGLFINLVIVQIIAMFFSSGGVGGSGMNSNDLDYTMKWFNTDIVFSFTLMWAFVIAIYLTTKHYRNVDFAFVSTRISSNLANIAFLATAATVGGVTASLLGYVIRIIVYFTMGPQNIAQQGFFLLPKELLISIIVTILYSFLVSALGYFLGMVAQVHRLLAIILPSFSFGLIILEAKLFGEIATLVQLAHFYSEEGSLTLFVLKVTITVLLLFGSSILLSKRMEVRE